MFEFLGIQEHLSTLLGAPVDLATESNLRPRVRREVAKDLVQAI